MPSLLADIRAECYALFIASGVNCFVRVCKTHDALFISDAPRHVSHPQLMHVIETLAAKGFTCQAGKNGSLLLMDLSLERYQALLYRLPVALPALPTNDMLHPVYALCRLLMLHPAVLSVQPLAPLRQVLKLPWPCTPSDVASVCVSYQNDLNTLHQECSALLRIHQPLPHGAGLVLSAWIASTDAPALPPRSPKSNRAAISPAESGGFL